VTNPQRQAAVNKLIEVVGEWRPTIVESSVTRLLHAAEFAIVDAYDELMRAPLDDPGPPKTRTAAPLTAHFAGMSMRSPAPTLCQRIVRRMWQDDGSHWGGGWTVENMEFTLNLKHQTVSARFNELRNAGWIYASGETRKNTSGRDAEVYRLTERARQLIQEARQLP
jgi:hypothetical protein